MGKLVLAEQDIINAVCVFVAREKNVEPEDVQVELIYDDDAGFSAEAFVYGSKKVLRMANLIEAMRLYIQEYMNGDPLAGIKLELHDDEGIVAIVG